MTAPIRRLVGIVVFTVMPLTAVSSAGQASAHSGMASFEGLYFRFKVFALLVLCVALLILPVHAFADTYTYSYIGNQFGTQFLYDDTTDYPSIPDLDLSTNSVSWSFTVATPLAANLGSGLSFVSITPLSFSISDDVATITENTSNNSYAINVATNGSGALYEWSFIADSDAAFAGDPDIQLYSYKSIYNSFDATGLLMPCPSPASGYCDVYGAEEENNAGSLSLTRNAAFVTPEPASLVLTAIGLGGVSFLLRKKRLTSPCACAAKS